METILIKALRDFTTGPFNQLLVNLSGQDGQVWEEEFKKFLLKERCWTDSQQPAETQLDFIIHPNRIFKPKYPQWMKKVMHPELELTGPMDYNLKTQVELWIHPNQEFKFATGHEIYEKLKSDEALNDCLSLVDLLDIQAKGISLFRKIFSGKSVFAWKSVTEGEKYNAVPYLFEDFNDVVLDWKCLDNEWFYHHPALRFRKSA
jgi:hypothetical protein